MKIMELLDLIKKRRSVRKFNDQKVDRSVLNQLIEAGIYAPSNCNIQGWRFIVVDDQLVKERMVDAGGSVIIKSAPAGILVLYDNRSKNFEYQDYIQSASAAMQNIFLMATDMGLGCCWINHLPSKRNLRKMFGIPRFLSPIGYLLIGFPQYQPLTVPRRYSVDKVINYNSFTNLADFEKISILNLIIKKILIKIYYLMPLFIKKSFLNKLLDKYFVKKFDN